MKTAFRLLMLSAMFPIAATLNAAKVNVTSVDADKLTDINVSGASAKASLAVVLDDFREHLNRTAKRYLADDQTLDIHFTDIDLAGEMEPWRNPPLNDVRWVKDIYLPRLKFDYKITNADGSVAAEGSENLSDMAFQMTSGPSIDRSITKYESRMLADWLRQFRVTKEKS